MPILISASKAVVPFVIAVASTLQASVAPSDDAYTIAQRQVLNADGLDANPEGVLANDLGAVGDGTEMARVVVAPKHGSLELNPDGSFRYSPHPNFVGEDAFEYQVNVGEPATPLDSSSLWRILVPQNGLPPDADDADFDDTWMRPGFDDATWLQGSGLMGYGRIDNVVPTTLLPEPTYRQRYGAYFRTTFGLAEAATYRIELALRRDDAAIIYLDGNELARSHEPGAAAASSFEDDFFLPVEGNFAAWADYAEEYVLHEVELDGVPLDAGEHTLAASVHNNLNPNTLVSSDLALEVVSATFTPVANAQVTLSVTDAPVPPVLKPDWFGIPADTDFDSAAGDRSLYSNDGLVDPEGNVFRLITSLFIDDTSAEGTVVSSSADTGHFVFRPSPGFTGWTAFDYRVATGGGMSEAQTATLFVFAPNMVPDPPGDVVFGEPTTFPLAAPAGTLTRVVDPPRVGTVVVEPSPGHASFTYDPGHTPFTGTQYVAFELQNSPATLVAPDATWKYLHPLDGADPAGADPDFHSTWYTANFDDSGWSEGAGYFAYGELEPDADIGTPPVALRYSAYFRHAFVSPVAGAELSALNLYLYASDGAIIYLNGVEVARLPARFTGEDSYRLLGPQGAFIGSVMMVPIPPDALVEGTNILAISVHNATSAEDEVRLRCDGLVGSGGFAAEVAYQIRILSHYEAWAELQFGGTPSAVPNAYPLADPDSDHWTNLAEYIFGTNPSDGAAVPAVSLSVDLTSATVAPWVSVPTTDIPHDTRVELQVARAVGEWWTLGAVYGGTTTYATTPWLTPDGAVQLDAPGPVLPRNRFPEAMFVRLRFGLAPWATD